MPARTLAHLAALSALAALPARAPAATTLAALEDEQAALFERVSPAVVAIRSREALASGFLVAPGLVVTAAHSVIGAGDLEVTLSDGRACRGEVVETSRDGLDLALVRLPVAHAAAALDLAPAAAVRTGSVVAVVGHGDGRLWGFSTGIVSSVAPAGPDAAILGLQLALRPGTSGAPVVDRSGRVVGVVTHGAPGSVAFAVRSDAVLRSLPALAGLGLVAGGATPPLEVAAGEAIPSEDAPALRAPELVVAPADPRPGEAGPASRPPGRVSPVPHRARVGPHERSLDVSSRRLAHAETVPRAVLVAPELVRTPAAPRLARAAEPRHAPGLLASELVPAALLAIGGTLLAALVALGFVAADTTPATPGPPPRRSAHRPRRTRPRVAGRGPPPSGETLPHAANGRARTRRAPCDA